KAFIDTVVWKFGDGLAALTLLLFSTTLRFSPRQVSWVNLVLLGGWVTAALIARRQYVVTLRRNIQMVGIRPDQESVPVLDQFTSNVFAEKLQSKDVNEVIYALDLFEMAQQLNAHSAVRNLLEHSSPHVRRRAIAILNSASDLTVREQVAQMVHDNHLDVRAEALLYLSRHDQTDPLTYVDQVRDFTDFSIRSATVSFLMRPGEGQNREAGQMILDGMIADLGVPDIAPEASRAVALLGDL